MPWAGAANTLGYYFPYSNPFVLSLLLHSAVYYLKNILGLPSPNGYYLAKSLAFFLFILFEYIGTNFPYLIAVPILLLSITYALLVPCLLAIILDYSSKTYATLDSSLQFSVALLGAYLAGFISLRLISTWGYVTVYWIVTIIAFTIWYFFRNYNQKS